MELVKILINGHKNTNQFLFRYINNKKSKIKKKISPSLNLIVNNL